MALLLCYYLADFPGANRGLLEFLRADHLCGAIAGPLCAGAFVELTLSPLCTLRPVN